jgi:hypothetical protein
MSPETRALLGQAQVVPLMEVGGLVIVGFAVYALVIYILEETSHPKRRPHPTTSEPDTTVEPLVTAAPVASAAPTTTAVPIATEVPTTKTEEDDPCMPLMVECLENKPQPAWNRRLYGKEKDCLSCYRRCKFHSKGTFKWPEDMCPR